jgi:predicted nuclease with TOPRIM domain
MAVIPFNQFEKAVDDLIKRVDELAAEKQALQQELEKLKGNHSEESGLVETLRKEKQELIKKLEQHQPDKNKEEKIKNHLDSILKKLEELQSALQ